MVKKNNEDMAGIVSEPKGTIPEVKPAKSLWPRPYETVRVEPVLDPVGEEAPPVAPPVVAPQQELHAEFGAGGDEGYHAPEVRADHALEPRVDLDDAHTPAVAAPELPDPEIRDSEDGPERNATPALDADEATLKAPAEPDLPREEPVATPPVREEPPIAAQTEPEAPEPAVEPPHDERRMREHRHVSVLDAADRQKPALDDARESRIGKFAAMAAGIVVALALATVAFVYGAGALGVKFGGGSDTTASASAPSTTPAVDPEELKALQDRIAELQAEVETLRQEKSAAADNQPSGEPAGPTAEQTAASRPEPGPIASIPGPTPAPGAVDSAPPAATPAAPPPQAVAPAPSSEPTPKASTPDPAPPTQAARTEPTPAPPPPAAAPAPKPVPKPKPADIARSEPAPAPPPPPSYRTQPGYEEPRGASPEMPVLQNWAVRDVYNGIAVVQGGRGAPLEVEPGDQLPGGNRVLAIRRLGGSWAVITERGIIAGN